MGTVFINEDVALIPSVGFVKLLMDGLSSQLNAVDKEFAASLIDEATYSWGFCDWRSLGTQKFNELLPAMDAVFTTTMREAPSKYLPNSYVVFAFSLIKALLYTDERVEGDVSGTGRLIIRDGVEWAAPANLFDMALEHFANGVYPLDEKQAYSLLAARVLHGTAICDLRQMDAELFHCISRATRLMTAPYSVLFGAPAFVAELNPRLAELEEMLHSDPRADHSGGPEA